ncbi:hypothetical protein GCM10011344_41150 [Dokdonia pacifica]|uniref:Uncharacterized protein n=1 Tax=Dokdonia pacifica TaxID=1627892 RepID=A0A239ABB4_9FLAO|nr:hypothetical protein [Dokdonia pacifica]GGG36024.1 hypothetical protein GCM10011344_41150 [Dokdonia pacifica]SNR92927.1 hypothetical protein SAMN06265376_104301 [Dokdonia pacifica]
MNPYNDELMQYEEEAEGHYDDFYEGEYEEDYETGLEGYDDEEEEYDGYDDEYDDPYPYEDDGYIGAVGDYDDFTKQSIGRINPNDRTLTIAVTNTSTESAIAILFGANAEEAQPNGVIVDVEESSHKEVREESKAHPFKIAGMKYSVSAPIQFDNVLRIQRRTASGTQTNRVYQPRNATSPQNFNNTLIDDDNFEMDVTGQDALRFTINANSKAVFTFTVKARANLGNLLRGQNVAELSNAPRTTGLPQLDLVRRKRPTALGLPSRRRPARRRPRPTRSKRKRLARRRRRPNTQLVRRRR